MKRSQAARLPVLLALLCLIAPVPLVADHDSFLWEGVPDWPDGALILDTTTPVDPGEVTPDLRYRAQRRIERLLPSLLAEAVLPLPLDSLHTVGERLEEDSRLFQALSDAAASGVVEVYSSLSRDLGEVRIRYRFPFWGPTGLASVFVTHSRAFPLQPVLGFVPTRPFSGLVIYARGELPAHGKDTRERAKPAFFPKLYDEELHLLLSAENCNPELLREGGMVAYSYSGERGADLPRIGAFPLRTVARGVFGENSTDLILSNQAVRQLLSLEANRDMLQRCRILIVLDPPEAR
jgi:hypothetical protein